MVLDASALLAYLRDEPGADAVHRALLDGAAMSTVNWCEVLAKIAREGADPRAVAGRFERSGTLGHRLVLRDFTPEDALRAARLRGQPVGMGLSLGDRACLALAARLAAPVLTAERAWGGLGRPWKVTVIR